MNQRRTVQLQRVTSSTFIPVLRGGCGASAPVAACPARWECAERRKRRLALQRRATNQAGPDKVPSIVYKVLCSPGQMFDPATYTFMELRFASDFSQVGVPADVWT